MSFLKTIKNLLGLDEVQEEPVTVNNPLYNRVTIEYKELEALINYFKDVQQKLSYQEIVNAADIKVVSQEVLKAAEHARIVGEIKKEATSVDKIIDELMSTVKKAGERGFYTGRIYYIDIPMYHIQKSYYMEGNNYFHLNEKKYYKALLKSVYLYIAIKRMQKAGYKIRIIAGGYDIFVTTNENVSDALLIEASELESYRKANDLNEVMNACEENAKDLCAEFPELLSDDLKREIGL